MRYTIISFILLCLVVALLKPVSPDSDTEILTITPSSDLFPFPDSLFCSDIPSIQLGSSWRPITIGKSTKHDIEGYIHRLDSNYVELEESDRIRFYIWDSRYAKDKSIPSSVTACIRDGIVTALDLLPNHDVFLSNLITRYGLPDTVTWTDSFSTRVVFWFEEGIAAQVSVLPERYGEIIGITYFSYQEPSQYKTIWPYRRTRQSPSPVGDVIYDPPLPTKENPFDFNAIVATITAQPTQTPLPMVEINPFPDSKYCSEIQNVSDGPTWKGITIGKSSEDDLDKVVQSLSKEYDKFRFTGGFLNFNMFYVKKAEFLNIPVNIDACIRDHIVTLIYFTNESPVFLSDFIAAYGLPDAVTWDNYLGSRVVFWFIEGIAITVNVDKSAFSMSYGQVTTTTYFPSMAVEGYKTRWPYKDAPQSPPSEGDAPSDPPLTTEQNPFDFDAMVATITTQQTRTPTALFIEATPTSTLMPTP